MYLKLILILMIFINKYSAAPIYSNFNLINEMNEISSHLINQSLIASEEFIDNNVCEPGHDCIPFYLCEDDNIINTYGHGILDIRIDTDDTFTRKCKSYMETCCAIADKTDVQMFPKQVPNIGCGYRNVDGIGFKITGDKDNETQYGEFPWMVAILKEEISDNEIFNIYQCGGSLIHPSIVMTAAHCIDVESIDLLKVRAGEWDTATKYEIYPDQDQDVSEIIIHNYFHKGALLNDIALLFLASPFELAENVQPICLPTIEDDFDYSKCYATGWGKDSFDQSGQFQVILKKIDLSIVPNNQCEISLRSTRLGKYFQLHSSFLCAGGKLGKDTCKGDGGSPLVCPIPGTKNRFYQAGIVSWGIGCGEEIPAVYSNVPELRSWIDYVLVSKGIDQKYFTP